MTVLQDAAEITRGLVGLDRRYANIPGWAKLQNQGRLGHAAEVCVAFAGCGEQDYTVDLRGWRPPATLIEGPPLLRLAGVLQCEHNLLVHLSKFPDAHTLRLVLDSQRIVSHEAARRVAGVCPAMADQWGQRTRTFAALLRETRDVRGLAGNHKAAAQAGILAARARRLHPDDFTDSKPLRHASPATATPSPLP